MVQAIGLTASRVNTARAMDVVAQSGGATFIAGRVSNNVTRSRYGKQAAQNMTRDVRNAQNLKSLGSKFDSRFIYRPHSYVLAVDTELKRNLENTIRDGQMAIDALNDQGNELEAARKAMNVERGNAKTEQV